MVGLVEFGDVGDYNLSKINPKNVNKNPGGDYKVYHSRVDLPRDLFCSFYIGIWTPNPDEFEVELWGPLGRNFTPVKLIYTAIYGGERTLLIMIVPGPTSLEIRVIIANLYHLVLL